MFSYFSQQFAQKIKRFSAHIWLVLLLVLCVSCTRSEPVDIALKVNVQAADRPGLYNVSGTTNLPPQSQMTVAAIRSLSPTNQELVGTEATGTFSILDRKIVEVNQGKWQTTLNLWQAAPDGRLQEAWQLISSQTGFNPSAEVAFVATFEPTGQRLKPKQQQVNRQDLKGSLVRFSAEGQPYVQATQSLQVNLPTGRTTPPRLTAEEVNGGWGKRYELSPQPAVTTKISPQQFPTTQTNAPLSPGEFLR